MQIKHQLEERLKIECLSETCKGKIQNYGCTGETGVPWNRKLLYICPVCAHTIFVKQKRK